MCVRGFAAPCGAGYRCASSPGTELGVGDYRDACSASPDASVFCPAAAAGVDTSTPSTVQAGFYTVGGRADCVACGSEQFRGPAGNCSACARCSRFEYEAAPCSESSNRVCAPCHADCVFGCTGGGAGDCLHRGTYISSTGVETVCEAGHYCTSPATMHSKRECPRGVYGASVGLSTSACDGPCVHGYYCAAGSTSPAPVACDESCFGCTGPTSGDCEACAPGFVDVGGVCELCGDCGLALSDDGQACEATTRTAEKPCPAGMYCSGGRLEGFCHPGFVCPQGSASPEVQACGSAAVYCPGGSSATTAVPAGSYSIPESAPPAQRSGVQQCPSGQACDGGLVVAASCSEHQLRLDTDVSMWHAVDPAGDGTVSVVWCDQGTDGGQWTTLHVATGGDGEPPFVSDTTVVTDQSVPVLSSPMSLPLATKIQLASAATHTLVWRSASQWLLIDGAPMSAATAGVNDAAEHEVTVTAPAASGGGVVTATAYMGYRRNNTGSGGDFYVSAVPRGAGTVEDRGDATWCSQMYLYSSSSTVTDGDAAYHAALSLGAWSASTPSSCATAEGGGLALYFAVRRRIVPSDHASCREHLDANPESASGLYTLQLATGDTATVYCDMVTDGGGWTVLYATSGADGEPTVTSDTDASGNALSLHSFNLPRSTKASLSAAGGQTLVWRGATEWLVADRSLLSASFGTAATSDTFPVQVRAWDGSTATGVAGWSTAGTAVGGDFAILLGADAAFDGHESEAVLLNSGCDSHLLYSSSPAVSDSDAGYGSAVALGSWSASTPGSCGDGAEGGSIAFRLAVRDRAPLCPAGYHRAQPHGTTCFRVLGSAVPAAQAWAWCSTVNAMPAAVSSGLDNAALHAALSTFTASNRTSASTAWLGLNDAAVNGAPVWQSGHRPEFDAFADGQGGFDTLGHCAVMSNATGAWWNAPCNERALPACMVPICTFLAGCVAVCVCVWAVCGCAWLCVCVRVWLRGCHHVHFSDGFVCGFVFVPSQLSPLPAALPYLQATPTRSPACTTCGWMARACCPRSATWRPTGVDGPCCGRRMARMAPSDSPAMPTPPWM